MVSISRWSYYPSVELNREFSIFDYSSYCMLTTLNIKSFISLKLFEFICNKLWVYDSEKNLNRFVNSEPDFHVLMKNK